MHKVTAMLNGALVPGCPFMLTSSATEARLHNSRTLSCGWSHHDMQMQAMAEFEQRTLRRCPWRAAKLPGWA